MPRAGWGCHTGPVYRWVVAGGLIERDGSLLLVRNHRRDGRVDWTPPGGVIDDGEGVLAGLQREVREETGLDVVEWRGPAYHVEAEAPDMDWHLRVEVHVATGVAGSVAIDDPDGIVEAVDFVPLADVETRLIGSPRWVVEPLLHWLGDRSGVAPTFHYAVRGTPADGLAVERRQ